MSNLSSNGLSRVLSYIKSWVSSALSSKANSSHNHSNYVPTSGGAVMGGATKIKIAKSDNSGELRLDGGTDWGNGGSLCCHGKDDTLDTGSFILNASNGTNSCMLMGFPNGTLTWGG